METSRRILLSDGASVKDALPSAPELRLVIGGRLEPEGDSPDLFATVRKIADLIGQKDKCGRFAGDSVHNHPIVPHDLVERVPERNRVAFTK